MREGRRRFYDELKNLYREIENIQADPSESAIRVTDPLPQESIAASGSEAGMDNDDRKSMHVEEVSA